MCCLYCRQCPALESVKPRPQAVCGSLRGLTGWAAISWRRNHSVFPNPHSRPADATGFQHFLHHRRPSDHQPVGLRDSHRRGPEEHFLRTVSVPQTFSRASCVMVVKTHWLGSCLVFWLRRERLRVSSREAIFTHSCMLRLFVCRPLSLSHLQFRQSRFVLRFQSSRGPMAKRAVDAIWSALLV